MKKLSVLSVPLIGLAGLAVWTQSLAGAPTDQTAGVVVVDTVRQAELSPRSEPLTTAGATSPSRKTMPLNTAAPASSAPDAPGSALTSPPVQMAQTQATDAPVGVSVGEDPGAVQHVAPTQVTSPAVAATEDSSSPVKPDEKGGLDGSGDAGDE